MSGRVALSAENGGRLLGCRCSQVESLPMTRGARGHLLGELPRSPVRSPGAGFPYGGFSAPDTVELEVIFCLEELSCQLDTVI